MTKITNKDVFDKADELYYLQVDQICKTVDIESVHINHKALESKFYLYQTSHWKFNSFHWANDLKRLADQLIYGFSKLKSHCLAYKEFTTNGESPSNTYGPVSFYSDSCILNLYSLRDKISLLVWSFFHPFNPNNKNEVLTYIDILKRLKAPRNFGFNFKGQDQYIIALNKMSKGNDCFVQLEKYRHYKTHRWEPRIEIYGIKEHQGFPYSVLDYDNQDVRPTIEYKKIKEVIWSYSKIEKIIENCMTESFKSVSQCFELLSSSDTYNGINFETD